MPQNFIPGKEDDESLTKCEDESYLALKSIHQAVLNKNLWLFIESFNKFIYDATLSGFFTDHGGRPASSWYKRVPYSLCSCKTDWDSVNRQLDEKECNCIAGKRFIAYKLTKEAILLSNMDPYVGHVFIKHIRQTGPVDIYYEPWQPIVDLEDDQLYS